MTSFVIACVYVSMVFISLSLSPESPFHWLQMSVLCIFHIHAYPARDLYANDADDGGGGG